MKQVRSGGGWPAIAYTLRKARQAGGVFKLWRAMRTRNACKTCALGMGGQRGGMVNEPGNVLMYYPEANELIGRSVDPISRTPAFKGATVTLIPTTAALPPDRPPAPPATSG